MKQILEMVILGKYSVRDLLIAAGIAVILFVFVRILMRVFRKKDAGEHFQFVDCSNCGWSGKVSRPRRPLPQMQPASWRPEDKARGLK